MGVILGIVALFFIVRHFTVSAEGAKPTGDPSVFRYIDKSEHEFHDQPRIPGSAVEYVVYFAKQLCTVNTYFAGKQLSTLGYHLERDEQGGWRMKLTDSSWQLVAHNHRTRMSKGVVPHEVGEEFLTIAGQDAPRWSNLNPGVAVHVEAAYLAYVESVALAQGGTARREAPDTSPARNGSNLVTLGSDLGEGSTPSGPPLDRKDDTPWGVLYAIVAASVVFFVVVFLIASSPGPEHSGAQTQGGLPTADASTGTNDVQPPDGADQQEEEPSLLCKRYRVVEPGDGDDLQSGSGLVLDTRTGLKWLRFFTPEFHDLEAATRYCSRRGMRLPTKSEAVEIAGPGNYCKPAWPRGWATWTSTKAGDGFVWYVTYDAYTPKFRVHGEEGAYAKGGNIATCVK